jgi:cytochrome c oxidase subunit 2
VAAGIGALAVLAATGCSTQDIPNQLSIPDPATDRAEITFHLWQGTWVALWVVGALTWALMLGAAVIYRRRREDHVPAQTRYNIPIEVMYTVTPLIVVAVFTLFTWRDTSAVTELSDNPDVTVNAVGFQWNWTFNYVDEQVYENGSPSDIPTLYLPQGERVRFVLTSPDVIHSFWVPAFLSKMDVVPGRTNQFEVTPTKLGRFEGKCAEMCGTYHSQMLFWVEVVTPEEYEQKIAELEAAGQVGSITTERDNDEAQNQGNTSIGGDS